MIHIGIADYGMNVYYGALFDYEERLCAIRNIGYEGVERMRPTDAADAMEKAALLARLVMGCATVEAPTIEQSIRFTAALGRQYVWVSDLADANTFDALCQRTNYLTAACKRYGISAAIHNHLGSLVETQEQLETYLARCPDVKMILDIGHLGAAGGDVRSVFDRYYDRITAVHLKDWKIDPENAVWLGKGYFCALGKGELAGENRYVVEGCIRRGFDGWIMVEQDTHLREPLLDLKESRELIRTWGV